MLVIKRKEKILEPIKEDVSTKVHDLSRLLNVTEIAICQGIEKLIKECLALREYGGVYLKNVEDEVHNFSLSPQVNLKQKEIIAE